MRSNAYAAPLVPTPARVVGEADKMINRVVTASCMDDVEEAFAVAVLEVFHFNFPSMFGAYYHSLTQMEGIRETRKLPPRRSDD